MKIWFLTSEIPTYNPGGIARYIDNFARYLAKAGHEVLVISRAEQAGVREIVPGYRLHAFRPNWDAPAGSESGRPVDDARFPYNLFDYWTALSFQFAEVVKEIVEREGPPDVIEAQEYNGIAYYLQQRQLTEPGYLEDVPVVINTHSPDFLLRSYNEEPAYQFPVYWNGQMEKACLYAADAVISPSRYLARQLEELLPDLAIEAFPLPWTDVSGIGGAPEPEIDSRAVLYLGRLEVRKGVLRLVAEAERLWSEGADFHLALAGADCGYTPRNTTVRQFIEKRYATWIASGHLRLPGALPHDELLALVRQQAVVVIPSIWENWPNTCIEAMSLGKVVVASVHGGQREMLGEDEQAGFLFSWDRPQGLGEQLKKALSLAPDRRSAMGAEAKRRIAALCAPEVVLPKRLAHFERVVAAHARRRQFPFVNRHLRNSAVATQLPAIHHQPGLVSAVVPFFNMGAYLRGTVESILASDYPQVEVVVVNDGSTEADSLAVLESVLAEHPDRVRVVHQANQGLAASRNTGVREAHGQYVVLVDADDQVAPGYISRAVHVLERYENVQIVFSWEQYFEGSQDIFPGWNFEFPYLLAHNQTCPVCVVDRAAWLTHGQNKTAFAYNFEDFESWIRMVAAGCGGVCLHEPLTLYRIRRDGLWQGSSRNQHLFLYDLLVKEHPELYREYGAELFCLQNANGTAQEWIKPTDFSPYDRRIAWEHEAMETLRRANRGLEEARDEALRRAAAAEAELNRMIAAGEQPTSRM